MNLLIKLIFFILLFSFHHPAYSIEEIVECNVKGCNTKYPKTYVLFQGNLKEDKNIIVWLPGGPGDQPYDRTIEGLENFRNYVSIINPYKLKSYNDFGPVPQAYGKDQPARILSVINWASSKGYKVWLGGHSNGGVRIVGLLKKYPDIQKNILGVILSATHVCGGKGFNCIKVKSVKWNVNTLVLFHEGDHNKNTDPKRQRWMFDVIKNQNKKNTTLVGVKVTKGPKSVSSHNSGHHMFDYDRSAHINAINKFLKNPK